MTKKIDTALRTALVLGLTLGAVGGLTAVTATQAQAFGLGDITGAAKKVGGAVKKGAKFAGKAGASMGVHAGKTAIKGAQGVRDASLTAAGRVTYLPTGVLAPIYFRATGQWNEKNRQILNDMEHQWNDMFDNAGDKMDRGIRRVGQATGEFVRKGGVTSGESLPQPEPSPEAKRRMQNGLRDFANGGGLNRSLKTGLAKGGAFYNGRKSMTRKSAKAPVHGITKENLKPSKGQTMKITLPKDQFGNVRSIAGRPVGGRKPIGRDKSVWGRPVGGRKPIGQDRSILGRPVGQVNKPFVGKGMKAPVQGITRQNLQTQNKKTRGRVTRDLPRQHNLPVTSRSSRKTLSDRGNNGSTRKLRSNRAGNNKNARSNRNSSRNLRINRRGNRAQINHRSNKKSSNTNRRNLVRSFSRGFSHQLKIRH